MNIQRSRKPTSYNRVKVFGRSNLAQGLLSYPACSFRLVIPRVDIFALLIRLQTKLASQKSHNSRFPITQPVPGSISVFNSISSSDNPESKYQATIAALVTSLTAGIKAPPYRRDHLDR